MTGPRWLKGLASTFTHPRGSSLFTMLPRTRFNYEREVDALLNSAVGACVAWLARTFPEAPIVAVERDAKGVETLRFDHAAAMLVQRPNPYYSGSLMRMALITDYVTTGNAYLYKARAAAGSKPGELWWLPSGTVEPRWKDEPGAAFVEYYRYSPGPVQIDVLPADIVHLRYGLDPNNPRKGAGPLRSLLREIFTDDEAANFSAALLRNLGVPGVILTPEAGGVADENSVKEIKARWHDNFGGDGRGDVMAMTTPTKVQIMSFNPQQMDLKAMRRLPEERVSAVMGIPAIVAGLGAGLDRSTFSNFAEAREAAYESCVIPLQNLMAEDLTTQLLPEFDKRPGVRIGFDNRNVRILQEDLNKSAERQVRLLTAGAMKRSEVRAAQGLEVTDADDVYLLPMSVIEVGPGASPPPALPAPAAEETARATAEAAAAGAAGNGRA